MKLPKTARRLLGFFGVLCMAATSSATAVANAEPTKQPAVVASTAPAVHPAVATPIDPPHYTTGVDGYGTIDKVVQAGTHQVHIVLVNKCQGNTPVTSYSMTVLVGSLTFAVIISDGQGHGGGGGGVLLHGQPFARTVQLGSNTANQIDANWYTANFAVYGGPIFTTRVQAYAYWCVNGQPQLLV